jgi:hypothetical protein
LISPAATTAASGLVAKEVGGAKTVTKPMKRVVAAGAHRRTRTVGS